ncbi:MAG: polyprenyl synthetase family protein [Rhizobiales bacterium]|nr:polyprenyl synthetase family protein [Hyphomicrobiales bacterium]MBI3674228.1 polyprenyl synthetase family protein [Hyphomicrobiales bacterium]
MEKVLSFLDNLAACGSATEALLDRLLPAEGAASRRLVEAMRYAALGTGKRLRPFLVTRSAALFDVAEAQALMTAAALECVHCYSLVHDDLPAMDDDDLRRGRPTLHRAFDEATAILAGDALLTFAFEILARPETHADPTVRLDLVSHLAKASGSDGMVGGQMLDMAAEMPELADIIRTQSLKTGALFGFACEAGAILGRADPGPLRQYAENIGLAFQIADDVLDVESTPADLGKATQKDQARGKATFVDLLGLAGAKARAASLADAAIVALSGYGSLAEPLREAARFMVARRR